MQKRGGLTVEFCIIFAFLLSLFAPLRAQTVVSQGALSGTVRDDSGGSVAGARLILTEESKSLIRESVSGRDGSFLLPSLIAGVYSVRVEKEGFSTERMNGLRIDIGLASIEITLHVGEVRTAIEIRPPSETELHAESNAIGSLIDSGRVQQLPLNGRNFLDLSLLAAGTGSVSPASNAFSSNVGPPSRTIILPATLPSTGSYSLNGINITGSRDGELAISPSIAAIDQFKVQESFLMPDQGNNPASISIVTKSGTNQFHGQVFEFLRNDVMDARSFFATGLEDLKQNQFGFASGGPLRKDRLWFYGFYEGLRELMAFSTAGYSPTEPMFAGNFTADGRVVYDPATYDVASGTRQPFPNNVIPASRINPVANKLLKYYVPGTSLASMPGNIYGNPRNTLNDDQGGLRLDAALSSRSQLFLQILGQSTPSNQPGLYPLSGLLYQNGSRLAMVQHVWSMNPRALNSLRIGFLRNIAIGGNQGQNQDSVLPLLGIWNTNDTHGVSAINLQGYSGFGRSNGEVGNRDNAWQLDDEITYTRGAHSFAFGAGLRYRRGWHLNGNSQALGTLSFQPGFTAQLGLNSAGQPVPAANSGDSFADFLLGLPVNGVLGGVPVVQYRATQITPYFQDNWRLSPNLTLNYGLSWFLETPPNPQGWARNYVHGFDPATGLVTYAALGQINPQAVATDRNNLSPRLGLAWKPARLKATVIRAGGGIYYSAFPWILAPDSLLNGSPIGAGASFTNPLTNPLPTYAMGLNIFPPAPSGGITSAYAANLPPGTLASAVNPGLRTACVSQWNVSIQHSLSGRDVLELDYLGASGHKLVNLYDLSQCRPGADLFCAPASKPWPRYSALLYVDSSGNSSYEALFARYEHRVNSGLNLRLEYSLAKALTDTFQSGQTLYDQISECRRCSKGPATFDVRNRMVGSLVWEMPFGKGQHFARDLPGWTEAALGKWTFTAIATFATGQPILLSGPNQTGSTLLNSLPNRVCDGRNSQLSENVRNNGFLWFDPTCFPVPPVGFFGNSGPTVLNGPGLDNWDIGLEKSFTVPGEVVRPVLRAELFNAWNHTQFQPPNANSGAGMNFGRISATRPPRLVQLALKIAW
jgi:hypothetical protein